ncbi:MAG: HD-GYP domain-containing protein, partial [Oscillospiraceae bacterium]|nr:HD-GYP domain-containing protein [Oscillospiraceae bacterium]
MVTKLYECSATAAYMVISVLIARFVFLVPSMKRQFHHFLYMFSCMAASLVACLFWGRSLALIGSSILLGVYIYITSSDGKWDYLHALKILPIFGISLGLLMPPVDIPVMLMTMSTEMKEGYALVFYLSLLFVLLLLRLMCDTFFQRFCREAKSRKLGTWERLLLYIIGSLMLVVVPELSFYDRLTPGMVLRSGAFINLRCVNSLICFAVTLTVCILAMRSSRSAFLRDQVMQMQNNLIITMADIVENRDDNTGGHIRRTARYVEIIARALKANHYYTHILDEQYITDMIVAAPLHDIGKIHIPDAVLKKEGRFTEEEFQIMKSHTVAGKQLILRAEKKLGYSSYLNVAVQMAGYHHEWWDGTGYPEGLHGEDIPLCARIMAVADVFDSLVSKRCYKGAMTIDEAYLLIARESGTHFDPAVV